MKDIIGQGLIQNSNIAIIELIKNAKDAGSKKVEIVFRGANAGGPNSVLVVRDYGVGMTPADISGKWLNIAYSEKRNSRRSSGAYYAGEKGIGRFSCDRLGRALDLYTKTYNGVWTALRINWPEFEKDDPDSEISDVQLFPRTFSAIGSGEHPDALESASGTTLIISDLRETWGETELERLKKELERFIIDPEGEFSIHLKSEDLRDGKGKLIFDGLIENKLLSRIDEKTIAIHSEIPADGSLIHTEIRHFGDVILSFESDNPYSELRGIKAQIHYLSQGAKVSFKVITGYTSTDYGSVMLFLNGFRVMPYGEPKDDWLRLNSRKAQGNSRFLGTRELFGLVEIRDEDRVFLPVTSREGVARNLAFMQLSDQDVAGGYGENSFLTSLVRTLEKYVVEGMDWDRISPENADFSYDEIMAAINGIIKAGSRNGGYRNVFVDEAKLQRIAKRKVEELKEFVAGLLERVTDKDAYDLTKGEKRDIKRYVERHEAALAAKTEVADAYRDRAKTETKRRLFAESRTSPGDKRLEDMQHLVGLWSQEIEEDLESVLADMGASGFDVADIKARLRSIHSLTKKINKLSAMITRANFNFISDNISHDIFDYIEDYIHDYSENGLVTIRKMPIIFSNEDGVRHRLNFSPLEFSMLLDNAFANSRKSNSKKVWVKAHSDSKFKYLDIVDDGSPLTDKHAADELFIAGITTTSGSGIGLSHIKEIANNRNAQVSIFSNEIGGTTLRLSWTK
ncbi:MULTISPECIES: ATP-binding protein [Agrobacterium]|uniref:ATP-binding protein n=1 Tax=Agrobacterium TaxID=357 RepID=UPI0027B91ACD|nr:ATP-binding protein [Agrobacterium sp. SORGH_AS_0745]